MDTTRVVICAFAQPKPLEKFLNMYCDNGLGFRFLLSTSDPPYPYCEENMDAPDYDPDELPTIYTEMWNWFTTNNENLDWKTLTLDDDAEVVFRSAVNTVIDKLRKLKSDPSAPENLRGLIAKMQGFYLQVCGPMQGLMSACLGQELETTITKDAVIAAITYVDFCCDCACTLLDLDRVIVRSRTVSTSPRTSIGDLLILPGSEIYLSVLLKDKKTFGQFSSGKYGTGRQLFDDASWCGTVEESNNQSGPKTYIFKKTAPDRIKDDIALIKQLDDNGVSFDCYDTAYNRSIQEPPNKKSKSRSSGSSQPT